MGARGRAMGYAMVGVADDWTAVLYNPAGLAQITEPRFGAEYGLMIGGVISTQSLRNLSVGANLMRGDFIIPPLIVDEPSSFGEKSVEALVHGGALGYVRGNGKLAFGIGVYGSGAGSSWEDTILTGGGDTIAAEIAFANVSLNIPIVASYQATEELSLGLTLGLHYGMLTADNNKYRYGAIPYVMATTQDTDGLGVGVDLGTLWKANDRLALGAVVKFPYTFEKSGETRVELSPAPPVSPDTTVEETYPLRVALGCAFRPDDASLVALSLTWHDWSDYNQKTEYEPQIPGVLENSSGNPSNWHDTVVIGLGYERRLSDRWALRCGLSYDEAPEPREARTLVGGQVVDSWKFAVGAGVNWEKTTLDFVYMHTYGPEVDGYIPGAGYSVRVHEFSVAVQKKF